MTDALEQTKDELTQSMTVLSASNGVITKLFVELDNLANNSLHDGTWFKKILDAIIFSQNIETGFEHGKAYALTIVKKNWEDLPLEVRQQYGFTFMNFAQLITGKERSTVDNYLNTADIWFVQKHAPLGKIKTIQRDLKGLPVKVGEVIQYDYVEFNPYLIPMTKLLLLNSRVTRNLMTDRLWEMLVDPYYTCDDIRTELAGPTPTVEPDFYFISEGPGIFVRSLGQTVCIAESLNWEEYLSNEIVKQGIDRLLLALGIRLDEDYILQAVRESYQG